MTLPRLPGFLFAFCSLLLPLVKGQDATPVKPAASAPGLVWRVTGGKSPLFLAGSFHLMKPENYPLPENYERAWKEAGKVVFEVAPDEMESPETGKMILEKGLLKSEKLSSQISAETWKSLSGWAGESGFPVAGLEGMKPWMASLMISVQAMTGMGYDPALGLEKHFGARLKKEGKTGSGLETAESQLSIFDTFSSKIQEEMLVQSLDGAGNTEKIGNLSAAWKSGDPDKIYQHLHDSFKDFPELEKRLLTDRNAEWIPKIEKLLQGDQAAMVLVGAGHLCGPGSVLEQLEKKGYRVVRMETAAAPPAVKKAA